MDRLSLIALALAKKGGGGGGAVNSVNGQTGTVVLDAEDVGAMPSAAIDALIALLSKVAYIDDDGQQYLSELDDALYNRTLTSIEAVFTQGGAVITPATPLDDLRQYLVVTAHYSDGSTRTVTDYTLDGTLTDETSTVTAAYRNMTDTFTVNVQLYLYELTEQDFSRSTELKQLYPYYGSLAKRISYTAFDLRLVGGRTYKFTVTSTKDTAQMGIQGYNDNYLTAVSNNANASNADRYDSGWQGLTATITFPVTTNNSTNRGVRLTFRQSDENPDITSDFAITRVTIEEVTA